MHPTSGHLVRVASFNVHAGIDGWGRPFDAAAGCLAMDADVLLVVEAFQPDEPGGTGTGAGRPSLRDRLVAEGGYELAAEATLARAVLVHPPDLPARLAPSWGAAGARDPGLGLWALDRPPRPGRRRRGDRIRELGSWQVQLFSRLPVRSSKVVPLTPLRREPLRRVVLSVEVDVGDSALTVVGTHFPHLSAGSPLRFGELRRSLPEATSPGVLMGDMNCFGPPLSIALPRWRRAVRGRTWPSWRPIAQPDHIFVSRAVAGADGEVMADAGSDHRPVRATLRL